MRAFQRVSCTSTIPQFIGHAPKPSHVVSALTRKGQFASAFQSSLRFSSGISPTSRETIDTLIIGGGPIGLSTAYHLATHRGMSKYYGDGPSITVIERDPTYAHASATLSAGGIRQQFSAKENIQMSLYGRDFLRSAEKLLSISEDEKVDVQFQEHGYLFLSSTPQGKKQLEENHTLQKYLGCNHHLLLGQNELKKQFPWLNADDILSGSYGASGEGWFDPWALIRGLKNKCLSLGVKIDHGFPIGTKRDFSDGGSGGILSVDIAKQQQKQQKRTEEIVRYHVKNVVNATGAHCNELMHTLAGESGSLLYPIPVEPRKRCIFFFHCAINQQDPDIIIPHIAPLTVCPTSNAYFRSEGVVTTASGEPTGNFLCGVSPTEENDRAVKDLSELDCVDHELWEEALWPALYHRVPAFGEVKVKSSWAGLYEYNTIDQNGIIDFHPEMPNVLMVNGFSGHGLQQSPAAGRAASELLDNDGKFVTLDLKRFSFDRCYKEGGGSPVFEAGIV